MKTDDVKRYKERLLALRSRLRGDVSQMANAVLEGARTQVNGGLSAVPIPMADVGSDHFERELTLNLMQTRDQTLDQIEQALGHMEEGVYGVCEQCQAKIPKSRLNAIPYAVLCMQCASRLESQ